MWSVEIERRFSQNSNLVSPNWWVPPKCNRICWHSNLSKEQTGNEKSCPEQIDQNWRDRWFSQWMRMCIVCNSRQLKPNQQVVLILEVPSHNCLLKCACYWILCRSGAFHVCNRLHCVSAMDYIGCPCNCSSWCNVRAESVTARLCCNLVQDHQHLTLGSFQYLCWEFESFRMKWDAGRLSNDESKKMVQSSAAFSWFVIFF